MNTLEPVVPFICKNEKKLTVNVTELVRTESRRV